MGNSAGSVDVLLSRLSSADKSAAIIRGERVVSRNRPMAAFSKVGQAVGAVHYERQGRG